MLRGKDFMVNVTYVIAEQDGIDELDDTDDDEEGHEGVEEEGAGWGAVSVVVPEVGGDVGGGGFGG
jgi:hypothetical protein